MTDKAVVPPPPKKATKNRLPPPPVQEQPPTNMITSITGTKDLAFKVSEEFKREFKISAAKRGMKQNEMFVAMFRLYEDTYPV